MGVKSEREVLASFIDNQRMANQERTTPKVAIIFNSNLLAGWVVIRGFSAVCARDSKSPAKSLKRDER